MTETPGERPRRSGRTVTIDNGVRLSYVEHGDADGTPLVLVPGLGDSWRSYEPVLEHLPASIRAFAVSQRGHGDSGPAPTYRFTDFVDDLGSFLETIGIESAFFAGHSSHGLVIERLVIEHPDYVRGLVLIGTALTLKGNVAAKELFQSTIAHLTDPLDAEFVRSFSEGTLAQPVPRGFLEMTWEETAKVRAQVFKDLFNDLLEVDLVSRLSEIEAPVLLVWGDQDAIVPKPDQEEIASRLRKSELVVYEDAGHSPHWEEPRRFASDVSAFVSL
jgi:non-heme chloroperoxidase